MATHSSILAWKIPWTEEPGRLQFMELKRVGHDLTTKPKTKQTRAGTELTLGQNNEGYTLTSTGPASPLLSDPDGQNNEDSRASKETDVMSYSLKKKNPRLLLEQQDQTSQS